jgi:hypothetical protein
MGALEESAQQALMTDEMTAKACSRCKDFDCANVWRQEQAFCNLMYPVSQCRRASRRRGGLIEAFIPDASLFSGERSIKITTVTNERASLKVSEHDPVEQRRVSASS